MKKGSSWSPRRDDGYSAHRPRPRCVPAATADADVDPAVRSFVAAVRGTRGSSVSFVPQENPDWTSAAEGSGISGDELRPRGVEVTEVRHPSVARPAGASSRNGTTGGRYPVVARGGGGDGSDGEPPSVHWQGDLAKHWRSAGEQSCRTVDLRGDDGRRASSPPLWSDAAESADDEFSTGSSGSSGGSHASDDGDSDTSGELWDRMESMSQEHRRLRRKDRPVSIPVRRQARRRWNMRRCATTMVAVAMAAALATLIYLVSEENYRSMMDRFPDSGLFKGLFGNNSNDSDNNSQSEKQREGVESVQLRYRRLPQGGSILEMGPEMDPVDSTLRIAQSGNSERVVSSPQEQHHHSIGVMYPEHHHDNALVALKERNRQEHLAAERWNVD